MDIIKRGTLTKVRISIKEENLTKIITTIKECLLINNTKINPKCIIWNNKLICIINTLCKDLLHMIKVSRVKTPFKTILVITEERKKISEVNNKILSFKVKTCKDLEISRCLINIKKNNGDKTSLIQIRFYFQIFKVFLNKN